MGSDSSWAAPEEVGLLKDFLHEEGGHLPSEVCRQLIKELGLFPVCVPHPHLSVVVPVVTNRPQHSLQA